MNSVRGAVLAVILMGAVVSDVRSRRIPNLLTFPGLALGLLLWTAEAGWDGLLEGLAGAATGAALLFLPFALGGLGAGDVKLMAVVGAFGGVTLVIQAFFTAALAGGLASAFLLWRAGRLGTTLRTILWDCLALVAPAVPFLPLPPRPAGEQERGVATALPYGVAIAFGAAVAWLWRMR
ncbi:MAG: A24 family peptidase [Bacillota bacterium]|nr:A24 family peptidase [Bacillota bacterium]